MAQILLTKNGTGSAYPTLLSQGELAINVSSGSLYYGTSGSANVVSSSFVMHNLNLVKSGSGTQGQLTASGNISSSGDIIAANYFADPDTSSGGYSLKGHGKPILSQNGARGVINLGQYHSSVDHSGIEIHTTGSANKGLFLDGPGNMNLTGHITASGNISSSGKLYGTELSANGFGPLQSNGHIDLGTGGGSIQAKTNITASNNISASGIIYTDKLSQANTVTGLSLYGNITASGHISMSSNTLTFRGNRKLRKTSAVVADSDGDIVYFGTAEAALEAGVIYQYVEGDWQAADADAVATGKGLLGVALDRYAPSVSGLLIRGMVTLIADNGSDGDILYLSTTAGGAQNSAPTGNGDIVRVVGYCIDSENNQIYFNPDNTFIEITA